MYMNKTPSAKMLAVLLMTSTLAFGPSFPNKANADWYKTYNNPIVPGMTYRVDWCLTWARGCGKNAADKYCSLMKPGAFALDFKTDSNIGATHATRTLGDNKICGEAFCDGFKSIACVTGGGILYNFSNPMHAGKRLDWCASWKKNCGKPAALAFCNKWVKKYQIASKVRAYWQAPNIGDKTPTKTFYDNKVCDQQFCDGFSGIVCAAK